MIESQKILVVVIPAFNEEKNIESVVRSIPRNIGGVEKVEVILIDDGSTDFTSKIALGAGIDHIITHKKNLGVGAAVKTGIQSALHRGADVICIIDGDGQFRCDEIVDVITPILRGDADVVVGNRFHSSKRAIGIPNIKRIGNQLVAKILALLSIWSISDAESGFRALSRVSAQSLKLLGFFTATHDMLLDLSSNRFRVVHVPVHVRYRINRNSRVVGNIAIYALKVIGIITMKICQIGLSRFKNRQDIKHIHHCINND